MVGPKVSPGHAALRTMMTDDSDLSIPYGCDIDHDGVELSIDAVAGDHARCEFVCPQCREQLTKKLKGEFRRPHFAHHMDATDRNCPWRTDEGVRQAYSSSQALALEAARAIRLFIQRRPHSNEVSLFGAIPPLSGDDVAKVTRGKLDSAFQINAAGSKEPVELIDLLPSGRAGWIELDPDAPRFRIEVKPAELVNGGSWVSLGIAPGDIFLGNNDWGRLVTAPRRVTAGQHLYYVVPGGTPSQPPRDGGLRLGHFEVRHLVVDQSQVTALQSIIPGLQVDYEALRVDVVSPLSVPPSDVTRGRIHVPRDREIILAVRLPKNKDRPLEIFPIPYRGGGQVTIPAAGLGTPRFLRLVLQGTESQRVLIHWPFEADRDWILDFIPVEPTTPASLSALDPVIGLSVASGPLLNPLFHPEIRIDVELDQHGVAVLPKITLVAPTGLTLELRGEFPGDDGNPVWLEEQKSVESTSLEVRLKDVFARGCRTLELKFAALGSVTLVASGPFESVVARKAEHRRLEAAQVEAQAREEQARREDEERARRVEERRIWLKESREKVREALRARRETLPRHISEAFVRDLLNLPDDAPRGDLPALRNLVRKARRELRAEAGAHQLVEVE